jgi:DNA-binding NarL/FixJ family response regulator
MKPQSIPVRNQTRIRILVPDDHPVVRDGIIANVKPQPDMTVVADAGDGVEALDLIKQHLPDVVMLDLRMPRMDGRRCSRCVRAVTSKEGANHPSVAAYGILSQAR